MTEHMTESHFSRAAKKFFLYLNQDRNFFSTVKLIGNSLRVFVILVPNQAAE